MNNNIWELKDMISSVDLIKNLDKSQLLLIIKDSMIKNSEYLLEKKTGVEYYSNKANILNYASEYISRYNELPIITL